MTFSVVLVNGGDFSNIDAPLEIEATSLEELTNEVKNNFGLDQSGKFFFSEEFFDEKKQFLCRSLVDLIITYCGLPITQLPRPGAPLFVSVKHSEKCAFSFQAAGDANFRKEVGVSFVCFK